MYISSCQTLQSTTFMIQRSTKELLCVEKFGDNQVALSPKCYTIWNDLNDGSTETKSLKLKGVSLKKNNIKSSDYHQVLIKQTTKPGININLQMKNNLMFKVTSMFHCGEMLEKGEGCEIDIESAIEYYKDADENGEMRAKEALIRLIGEE